MGVGNEKEPGKQLWSGVQPARMNEKVDRQTFVACHASMQGLSLVPADSTLVLVGCCAG